MLHVSDVRGLPGVLLLLPDLFADGSVLTLVCACLGVLEKTLPDGVADVLDAAMRSWKGVRGCSSVAALMLPVLLLVSMDCLRSQRVFTVLRTG